jgi:NADH oxidase (H2O2-forming)
MEKTDILIIGGGPSGIVSAINARRNHPDKKILLVRKEKKSIIPCGIPYIFNHLNSVEKDLVSDENLKKNNIILLIDNVLILDNKKKIVFFEKNKEIGYDKLILATGSKSTSIPIKGINKKGVWYIKKNFDYLKNLKKEILKAKNITIIGGGFIGVELADELSNIKKLNINIVEKLESCLTLNFDKEFSDQIEKKLRDKKVKLYFKKEIKEILGDNKVEAIKIGNKKIISDLVIISVGLIPNTDIAEKIGIKRGKYGGIVVNEYMETNKKDIFAVGDCVEKFDLITKKNMPVMLASTACYEARIAAYNLYKRKNLIKNSGILTSSLTSVDNLSLGITGLNEKTVKKEKIDFVLGKSETMDSHPGTIKNSQKIKVKLIFSKKSGRLLGGQIIGSKKISEMINLISLAIQKKSTFYNLGNLQIATHPLLTSSPVFYPIITASQDALYQAFKKL